VLAYNPARGEVDREFRVNRIAAIPPGKAHEMGFTVRMEEPAVLKQSGRAGMIEGGARAETA
jgi:hypothetical protein